MTDRGIDLSDDVMRSLAKRLEAIYGEAYRTAIQNEREWISKLASLPDDAPTQKRRAFANEVVRRGEQANRIAAELANAGQTARDIINGEMSGIYGLNRDFAAYSINRQVGLSLDWTLYDRRQIEVLMREHQSPFTNIAYDNLGDGARIAKQLQNQLAQSVILGESQQRLTQRIRSVTGVELNRARRIAQTERVRVQSEGRQLGFNEATAMGVEMDKQWIARLVNTRDTHAELHGTVIPAAESFVTKNGPLEFLGDPDAPAAEIVNCHCFVKPMVKSASPELAAHREKFHEDMRFEEFRKNRLTNAGNGGIIGIGGGKMNTGAFERIKNLDEEQKIKFFGGKTKAALFDAGLLDKKDYFKPLKDIDLSGIVIPDRAVMKHSTIGDYKNPSKDYKEGRLSSGGHGQQSFAEFDRRKITYNITRTAENGVRYGNIPTHEHSFKRKGEKQTWFPKDWTEHDILSAGIYTANKGIVPINASYAKEAVYKNVRIRVDFTNGLISTICPSYDQP